MVVSIGLLCFLLYRVGPGKVASNLTSMDYRYVPLVLVAFCLSHFMNGMSLKLSSRMIRMGWGDAFLISMRSWGWGQFTPGRIGEISLISYLHDLGMPWGTATSLAFANRAIVFLLLTAMAVTGMILFGLGDVAIRWAVLLLGLGCLGGTLVLGAARIRGSGSPWAKRFGRHVDDFKGGLKGLLLAPGVAGGIALTHLVRLLFMFGLTKLLFLSMGADVDYLHICVVNSAARFAALLPVSINGLGVREGLQVWLFGSIAHIDAPVVLGVAIAVNVVLYAAAAVVILVPAASRRKGGSTGTVS